MRINLKYSKVRREQTGKLGIWSCCVCPFCINMCRFVRSDRVVHARNICICVHGGNLTDLWAYLQNQSSAMSQAMWRVHYLNWCTVIRTTSWWATLVNECKRTHALSPKNKKRKKHALERDKKLRMWVKERYSAVSSNFGKYPVSSDNIIVWYGRWMHDVPS